MFEYRFDQRGWRWPLTALITATLLCLLGPVIIDVDQGLPLSLQSLLVCWLPLVFGWRAGVTGVAAYVLLGALGVPVFAGGRSGLEILAGPTGGYLLGMPVAALATGLVGAWPREDASDRQRYLGTAIGMLVGHAIILAMGIPWQRAFSPEMDIPALLRRLSRPALLKCALGLLLSVGVMRAMPRRA